MAHGFAENDYSCSGEYRNELRRSTSRWPERVCLGITIAAVLLMPASKWLPRPEDPGEALWLFFGGTIVLFFMFLSMLSQVHRCAVTHLLYSLEALERKVAELSDQIGKEQPKAT
jgi:hypothetical protein